MNDVPQEHYPTVMRHMIGHEDDVTRHRLLGLLVVQGLVVNAVVTGKHGNTPTETIGFAVFHGYGPLELFCNARWKTWCSALTRRHWPARWQASGAITVRPRDVGPALTCTRRKGATRWR